MTVANSHAYGEIKWVRKKIKRQSLKQSKQRSDLLLDALLDEANLDVEDADAIINACYALEALKLAEGSEMTTESQDGAITKHYMFIATEKLRGLLATLGMLDDISDLDMEAL